MHNQKLTTEIPIDLLKISTALQRTNVRRSLNLHRFPTLTLVDGIISTEDGWPSESFIEFAQSKRLLVGYGIVDPQMQNYNFSGDQSTIFPAGYSKNIEAARTSYSRLNHEKICGLPKDECSFAHEAISPFRIFFKKAITDSLTI